MLEDSSYSRVHLGKQLIGSKNYTAKPIEYTIAPNTNRRVPIPGPCKGGSRDSGFKFQTDQGFWIQISKRARFRIQISKRAIFRIQIFWDSYFKMAWIQDSNFK